jgi:large subunit ribosomal protein L13
VTAAPTAALTAAPRGTAALRTPRLARNPRPPYPGPSAFGTSEGPDHASDERADTVTPNEESVVRTYSPKVSEIQRTWYVVDASDLVLGRLATEVARILRGKHQPHFAPHVDTGDHVVVVNADKVVLTAGKADSKFAYRHSGYPGGLKKKSYAEMLDRSPEEVVRRAVRGMIPKNTLGRQQLAKLKVYAGPDHPHAAQNPRPLDLSDARRAG